MKNRNYFYTFGTSKTQPFELGHVKVSAKNLKESNEKFVKQYGWTGNGKVIRCAGIYSEKEFKDIHKKYKEVRKCHNKIK